MNNDKLIYKKGGFGIRFCAYIIDLLIIFVLSVILAALLIRFHIPENLISLLIPPLYGSLFIWKKGATPGKMLFKLKVVNESYKPTGLGTALIRETIGKALSNIVFGLGYLWILLDKKNQAWHDKIAHTLVVQTDNTGTLIPTPANEIITLKRKITFGVLILICILPALFMSSYMFFFRPFQISGDAMSPNFKTGEYYITQITHDYLKRGDVIILQAPTNPDKNFIKRIIALPGETVTLYNGSVYINDKIIDESEYLNAEVKTFGGSFLNEGLTITVPENSYIVLGDNRPFSSDSREWGFVPQKNIISKILFCYWNCK